MNSNGNELEYFPKSMWIKLIIYLLQRVTYSVINLAGKHRFQLPVNSLRTRPVKSRVWIWPVTWRTQDYVSERFIKRLYAGCGMGIFLFPPSICCCSWDDINTDTWHQRVYIFEITAVLNICFVSVEKSSRVLFQCPLARQYLDRNRHWAPAVLQINRSTAEKISWEHLMFPDTLTCVSPNVEYWSNTSSLKTQKKVIIPSLISNYVAEKTSPGFIQSSRIILHPSAIW